MEESNFSMALTEWGSLDGKDSPRGFNLLQDNQTTSDYSFPGTTRQAQYSFDHRLNKSVPDGYETGWNSQSNEGGSAKPNVILAAERGMVVPVEPGFQGIGKSTMYSNHSTFVNGMSNTSQQFVFLADMPMNLPHLCAPADSYTGYNCQSRHASVSEQQGSVTTYYSNFGDYEAVNLPEQSCHVPLSINLYSGIQTAVDSVPGVTASPLAPMYANQVQMPQPTIPPFQSNPAICRTKCHCEGCTPALIQQVYNRNRSVQFLPTTNFPPLQASAMEPLYFSQSTGFDQALVFESIDGPASAPWMSSTCQGNVDHIEPISFATNIGELHDGLSPVSISSTGSTFVMSADNSGYSSVRSCNASDEIALPLLQNNAAVPVAWNGGYAEYNQPRQLQAAHCNGISNAFPGYMVQPKYSPFDDNQLVEINMNNQTLIHGNSMEKSHAKFEQPLTDITPMTCDSTPKSIASDQSPAEIVTGEGERQLGIPRYIVGVDGLLCLPAPTTRRTIVRISSKSGIQWHRGFSIPLGKEGRAELIKRMRTIHRCNRDFCEKSLEEKGISFRRLAHATVEELWRIAYQWGLFEFAIRVARRNGHGMAARRLRATHTASDHTTEKNVPAVEETQP